MIIQNNLTGKTSRMADVKNLKVVLVKTPGERISGDCDNRRLIKSLNVRVHKFEHSLPNGKVCVEIWEPLTLKTYTDRQQEIFYKNADLAMCVAGISSLNFCSAKSFSGKIKEAYFYLGEENVLSMSNASMGIRNLKKKDACLIGQHGQNVLTYIQCVVVDRFINE